jgi:adenylate cyclase
MEDILASGGDVLAGKAKEITVFFSDVRNFTNISEAIGDAKVLIEFMNEIMDPMTEIIIHEKGTVDKFIGDAIMAYWNAPGDVPDHADRAVSATLKQQYALKILNKKLRADPRFINVVKMSDEAGLPIVDIGVGLNTGVAVVGEMGSTHRSDYTCIGDPINVGARLESLCKYYNSKLNLSNFTKEQLQGKYIFRFLDLVTVKGKKEPVEIWQIHDFDSAADDNNLSGVPRAQLDHELELYHHAIELYKGSKFAEALEIFKDIDSWENKTNKYIYGIYIERCEHYIQEPPVDFNGVFKHTTKG